MILFSSYILVLLFFSFVYLYLEDKIEYEKRQIKNIIGEIEFYHNNIKNNKYLNKEVKDGLQRKREDNEGIHVTL